MIMCDPDIFSACAVSSKEIRLECIVPKEAVMFEWQYTFEEDPKPADWITITISDPSDFQELG
ncbi:MAG: hypothetical protein Q4G69_03775 [Planctomycetia bacterium]|nr:hypothetical protein [Planctomycetia bacterium]